ncbi:MAG: folate-binding protein [Novosphingobium sp.]
MTSYYLRDRAIIRLSPTQPDENVGAFLQGLLTNDVEQNGGAYAALLSPQGKVLFDLFVEPEFLRIPNAKLFEPGLRASGAFLIDCEASQADALVRRLSMYRLRRRISIQIEPTLGVWWDSSNYHDGWPDKRLPNLGHRGISKIDRKLQDGSEQFRKRRLECGVCEGHAEMGDLLWLECNAAELNGVSFTKGCYVGQENTARMNWRAKVNRRLVVVPLSESDPARQRAAYPELGLAVDHRRVEDIKPEWQPRWLQQAD